MKHLTVILTKIMIFLTRFSFVFNHSIRGKWIQKITLDWWSKIALFSALGVQYNRCIQSTTGGRQKLPLLEFLTIGMYAKTFTIDRHFCRRSRAPLAMVTFKWRHEKWRIEGHKFFFNSFSRWILWLRRPSEF